MAGVIGEIDPLARIRLAIDPAHAGPAQKAGQRREEEFGEHGSERSVVSESSGAVVN